MSLDLFTHGLLGSSAFQDGSALGLASPVPSQPAALPASAVKPTAPPAARASQPKPASDFRLAGDRQLATGWKARATDNIAAIRLAGDIQAAERPASPDEQIRLARFTGFGATALANNMFRRPGEKEFRPDWASAAAELEEIVNDDDYASLARSTQYAHFTPEPVARAVWAGLVRLGFRGGRVLEPGIGVGIFPALLPKQVTGAIHFMGVELDPVTARIAKLLQPSARIIQGDFTRTALKPEFDLAIGNPPFSDRRVRSDPDYRKMGFRLHDYFIAKAIDKLRPGGLAAFVTSTGTMDKLDSGARHQIARSANLIGAFRLPEGSFRDTAGTDVVVDLLFFRKRQPQEDDNYDAWVQSDPLTVGGSGEPVPVNRWFIDNPACVLGRHAVVSGQFGDAYTCLPNAGEDLASVLTAAINRLPSDIYQGEALPLRAGDELTRIVSRYGGIREGSYFAAKSGALMQVVEGRDVPVAVKSARNADGIFDKQARIIRKLIPIRDAVRSILTAQEQDQPWKEHQVRLRIAWSSFVREFGPINFTTVTVTGDEEAGAARETHRRPNIAPFLDDPDCWVVASIEDYDIETNTARPGPIFSERVIAPPTTPVIASPADALAVTLADIGEADIEAIAELLDMQPEHAVEALGEAIYRDPVSGKWETADAYLSGPVRSKLATARLAAESDPAYARNVDALERVQPVDLKPSDITARLGAPWLPVSDIVAFIKETMDVDAQIIHSPLVATWTVRAPQLAYLHAGTSEWGTHRRDAGQLLADALNSTLPQIYDTERREDGSETRVLNTVETEAAKEKLQKIKDAFSRWVWTDLTRADRLSRLYNDTYNNLVPRAFDGMHLQLPGASAAFSLYAHQKRVIWRIIASGATYIAHAVGAGKTLSMAAAVMEQRRLGLINCAMLVVPGHCLAQAAREFLAMYPNARILVADETNFTKDKRHRFLSRAATANWDAIIITHSAFKFIPAPEGFERRMVEQQLASYEDLITSADADDRVTRKRLERMKEGLKERLEALISTKDDLLTISQIGVDQIIVDEAQEFRKLSFATNMSALRGIDPNGSQRAWDLYVKSRFLETLNPGRALVLASGTPITNTLGEMFTLQRYMDTEALAERGLHEFDAWAANFGDTSTELELQPSGKYKPVTRFAQFVNVPELIAMFRSFADVVLPADLRDYVKIPARSTGQRQIITSSASTDFNAYQQRLATRIKAIEERNRPPQPGDDILLSVITDGRHAAIDLRLVEESAANDNDNKLNDMIRNVLRIWRETSDAAYLRKDGKPYELLGAGQLIFSDLGTLSVEASRGFSAYRWIRDELIRLGVPAGEIAFMQDYKKSEAKQRLFNDFNAGKIRILIGSSETMGTGVNVQLRLKALHHLDVPWLPSQIEQREGRIERQGNQHDEIDIYAYATLGSMDAPMWQNNERKARFIAAALSGDTSVRRLDDVDGGGQANQFAMAKAIASGDARLMQKAGLEAEIARMTRLRSAHFDDQLAIRRAARDAGDAVAHYNDQALALEQDIARRIDTAGDMFRCSVTSASGRNHFTERAEAGSALCTEIVTLVHLNFVGERKLASIGGFVLVFNGLQRGRHSYEYETLLLRAAKDLAIDLPVTVTAKGAISRLEHALASFDDELAATRARKADAERKLASYGGRAAEGFPLEGELNLKLEQLRTLDRELAATAEAPLSEAA